MKVILLLLFLSCCIGLRADLLDDISRQMDLLEKEYWLAQRNPSGDYHEAVRKRLFKLRNNANRVVLLLRKERKHTMVKLDSGVSTLVRNYDVLKPEVVKAFYFTFKGTGMSDYTKEFRNLQKEKEEQKAEDSNGKKRPRRRAQKVTPNLKNVDMVEYERWISERISENLETFLSRNSRFFRNSSSGGTGGQRNRKSYKGFASNEHEKVHNLVSEYLIAVKEIRMGLVKARQSTNIEFK